MKQPLNYKEMISKVEEINTRNYDYEQPFFDAVDQLLDESEGKHVAKLLTESFERMLTQVSTEMNIIEQELSLTPSCKAGCAHCCYFPVLSTRLEAKMMLMFIHQLPKERKEKLLNQIKSYSKQFSAKLEDVKQINFKTDESYKMKYINLKLPCVFLDEKSKKCTAYDIRPVSCRTYVNYVDVNVCEKEDLPEGPVTFEFLHHYYVQGMNEIIVEILEVVKDKDLGFSYPKDAADVHYLPILLEEELAAFL